MQPEGRIDERVVTSRGRYRAMGPNLRVREVVVGDGEGEERHTVCPHPRQTEPRRRHRAGVLAELAA